MQTSINSEVPAATGEAADERRISWWRRRLAPLIAGLVLSLTFTTIPRQPVTAHTDASWSAVLQHAHRHGLQFGKEVVFTYGPLGFLTTEYYSERYGGLSLTVNAALCALIGIGISLLAWRSGPARKWLLLWVAAFVLSNVESRLDLLLDTGLLYWTAVCLTVEQKNRFPYIAVLIVLAGLGALTKVSFLILGAMSVAVVSTGLLLRGQRKTGCLMLLGFACSFLAGWRLTGQPLSNLREFLVNSYEISRGYNESMVLPRAAGSGWRCGVFLLLAVAAAVARLSISVNPNDRRTTLRAVVSWLWLAVFLFAVWKHAIVRHLYLLVAFVPLWLFAMDAVVPLPARSWPRFAARALFAIACLASLINLQANSFLPLPRSLLEPFRALCANAGSLVTPASYLARMNAEQARYRTEMDLPVVRKTVRQGSIDVFGRFQAYALLNGFNYHPRPVIQSYSAYTPKLMQVNEAFYQSTAAPEYVLFNLNPIDNRLPALEDALVLRHLLRNYAPAGEDGIFLLLRAKSANPQSSPLTLVHEEIAGLAQRLRLDAPTNANVWMEVLMDPSIVGRATEILAAPPVVRMSAWSDGAGKPLVTRRTPPEMLRAGFIASPLLLDQQDVVAYYAGAKLTRPAAWSVQVPPGDERCWKGKITFRLYVMNN